MCTCSRAQGYFFATVMYTKIKVNEFSGTLYTNPFRLCKSLAGVAVFLGNTRFSHSFRVNWYKKIKRFGKSLQNVGQPVMD